MNTYYDKENKKWKVGKNGKPIYNTEKEANRAYLDFIVSKILDLKNKRSKATSN